MMDREEREPFEWTFGKAVGICIVMTFIIMTIAGWIADKHREPDLQVDAWGGLTIMVGIIYVLLFWVWMFAFHDGEWNE